MIPIDQYSSQGWPEQSWEREYSANCTCVGAWTGFAYGAGVLEEKMRIMHVGQAAGPSRNVQGFEAVDSAVEAVVIVIGSFLASHFGDIDDEIVAAGCPDGAGVSRREEGVESAATREQSALETIMSTASMEERTACLLARDAGG